MKQPAARPVKDEKAMSCAGCRFYKDPMPLRSGWCRRFPEAVQKDPTDTCGEFKPR